MCCNVFDKCNAFLLTFIKLTCYCRFGYKLTAWKCALNIYREKGIGSFYKGITASYYGLSETVIHLVIYEEIKAHFRSLKDRGDDKQVVTAWNFVQYMGAAAMSKTIGSCLCYPHGMF